MDDLLVANGTSNEQRILDLATNVGLIVGHNEAMRQVIQTAYKVAGKHVNVLIGEKQGRERKCSHGLYTKRVNGAMNHLLE